MTDRASRAMRDYVDSLDVDLFNENDDFSFYIPPAASDEEQELDEQWREDQGLDEEILDGNGL